MVALKPEIIPGLINSQYRGLGILTSLMILEMTLPFPVTMPGRK